MEFHLLNDLLAVYVEITSKNRIRLGTHDELFHPDKVTKNKS